MPHSTLHRNALTSALALALFVPLAVLAQSAPTDPPPQEPAGEKATGLDKVVVTGSRIKRSELEGPAPVTVITGEQMKKFD